MTFEPNIKAPSPSSSWLNRLTCRLSISQKISYGYFIALSIVVLGTTAGFAIGDYYQQQAVELREHAEEEIRLLNRLQNSILQARSDQQQFISLTQKPELLQKEYSDFLGYAAEVNQVLSKINSYVNSPTYQHEVEMGADANSEDVINFLKTYKGVPEVYFQQVEELLRQIDPPHLKSEKIEAAQKLLLNFSNSSVALKLDNLSDDLTEVINGSIRDSKRAETALIAASSIRFQIIVASLILSVAIAILCAMYTSRAIASPITAATKVAQQVTSQENFNLQVPVTTSDEVGVLTTTLNHLIQKVKYLLEEQKAATEATLIQSEKMSSLGRMLAGVAHEINNPVNFIYGNLIPASEYVEELLTLLDTYETEIPNPPKAVREQAEEIDFDFIKEDLPKLLQSMQVGADRVRQIVLSLKNFSHLDDAQSCHSVDLHACIDSTLLILNNRVKKGIKIVYNYSDIPTIEGYTGLLYQVFMNLLSNAIDALEEKALLSSTTKEIAISTERLDKEWVVIKIADNGSGIAPENQKKIFDTFFTTKPRGTGTGLGLAISHQIVVEKHGGKLTCKSEIGMGTEFAIALPIKHSSCISNQQRSLSVVS